MNKKTLFEIGLSVFCLILLLGLGIYLLVDRIRSSDDSLLSTESPFLVVETEKVELPSQAPADSVSATDAQTAAALEAIRAAQAQLPAHQFLFVGDSRTVGMGEAEEEAQDTCLYVGAVGQGYSWFSDTGLALMEAAMNDYPDVPIILNLGVNDLSEIDRYLELYRTFEQRYPDRTFYYLSVNPVTEQSAHVTNMEIAAFNTRLREEFPDQYLDSNTYLRAREFESADGVHYSADTYRLIHDYVVRQIAG